MPTRSSFDYAVIRFVPLVERGEFINVGIILFCRTQRYLAAEIVPDRSRLQAFAPQADVERVVTHLNLIPRICRGEGPIGQQSLADRFHWLVAPRSTIVQTSAVHCGFCTNPATALQDLLQWLVLPPQSGKH